MINEYNAKRYCKEAISKIENYDKAINDPTQTWCCHHRTEIWWNCSEQDLKDNECYYGRKALELIFLTPAEHNALHKTGQTHSDATRKKIAEATKGRTHSAVTRSKISAANKGERNPNYGKSRIPSIETRKKMSAAAKARWARRRAEKEGGI